MAKEYYHDRCFPTKHIKNLPKEFSFNKGTKVLTIDYATTDQLDVYKKLINDAAIRGDNVGVDEYNEVDSKTDLLFHSSEIFQAKDPDSGQIEAVMFIQNCLYQCSFDSCSASVHVFKSSGIDKVVYAELVSLMGEFAHALDIGYTQICTHVAFCLSDLYLELRKQGFVTVVMFPDWVEIAGVGVTDNAVMVKQLDVPERNIRPTEEILKMMNSMFPPERVQLEYSNTGCLQVPLLPITATTHKGIKFTFRNARIEDDEEMFEVLKDASRDGDGFGIDDFSTLNSFRMNFLANNYALIIEEQVTKNLAGMFLIVKARQSRMAKRSMCCPTLILMKQFRSTGLSFLVRSVTKLIEKSIGFKREILETFSTNRVVMKPWKSFGVKTIGVFPKGAYQKGHGWVDVVYGILNLEDDTDMLLDYNTDHLGLKKSVVSKL